MLIDSHCHLNYKGLVENQSSVLSRARGAGVTGFLNISTKRVEWNEVIATAQRESDVWASVGVHPHEADGHLDLDPEDLAEAASSDRVIAVGETGLDYFYDHSDRAAQQSLFRRHIAVARELDLPIIIHTRDAEEDTFAILRDELSRGPFRAVIHCFTGSPAFARQMLDLGLSISISGIVTFRNAKELQTIAAGLPNDRMLVETDSPFLAPVPNRGKPCEPAYLPDTVRFLAELRGDSAEQLAEQTTNNFHTLFSRAAA